MLWIPIGGLLILLGLLVWWGYRKSGQVEDDTSYMEDGSFQPLRFKRLIPWQK